MTTERSGTIPDFQYERTTATNPLLTSTVLTDIRASIHMQSLISSRTIQASLHSTNQRRDRRPRQSSTTETERLRTDSTDTADSPSVQRQTLPERLLRTSSGKQVTHSTGSSIMHSSRTDTLLQTVHSTSFTKIGGY